MIPENRPTLGNKVRSFFDRDWRHLLAWIAGLLVFGSMVILSIKAASFLGIPADDHTYYIGPNISFSVLSIMIAFPVGISVYKGQIRGLFNAREKICYKFIFFGVLIYGVISFLLGLAFGYTSIYVLFSDIAVIAVLVSIIWPLLNKKIKSLSSPDDQFEQKKSVITPIIDNLLMCAFGGVLLALFLAYAWANFKLFRRIEALLEDTFLEGFHFVIWIITFFGALMGFFIILGILGKASDWWTGRKEKSATKIVDGE